MEKKRVTQEDVAKRAGVSQTAVSQILGGLGKGASNFRPETQQKVLQAAQELGYTPSIMARALRTNQTMTIGVVQGFITDELELRITRGIHEIATERGYGLLIGASEQDPDMEKRVLEQFRQYQVDGLIFVDSWSDPGLYLNDESYPPMIFVQLRQATIEYNCIGADNLRGGYDATRHLLDLGYRRVGVHQRPGALGLVHRAPEGLPEGLRGLWPGLRSLAGGVRRLEVYGGLKATQQLLDRHPEVDAIFVENDLMAAGCIQLAVSRGLRVPQDLALVGYDDRYLAEALTPPLTSFALPLAQMGRKATHLLIDRLLRRKTRTAPSMTVAGHLAIRASCGAVSSNGT
jgi:LacI family transcriptional regulator